MRFAFILLLGALLSGQCNTTDDPYQKLEGCSVTLFSFIMTRLQQQVEEYTACQQLNAGDPNGNCSESIQLATIDLQRELLSYADCTKNIR